VSGRDGDEAPRPVAEPQTPVGGGEASGPVPDAEPAAEVAAAPGETAEEAADATPAEGAASGSAAGSVAAGILASRLLGLVREKAVLFFFGVGPHLDVFQLVMRGANLLNNLLGEGTLSASFIPIYSRLIEEGRARDAGRFAGAVLGLLAAAAAGAALVGVVFAEAVVTVIGYGFRGDAAEVAAGTAAVDRFDLAVTTIRITLPMAGFLALSAWALGVLNSHRRFFLPYVAPTLWNVATVAGLAVAAVLVWGDPLAVMDLETVPVPALDRLLLGAVVGAFVGGLLQFGVQLPLVWKLMRGFRFSISTKVEGVREALRAFGPVVAGKGVAQVSSYLDTFLATLATAGTLGALRPATVLYILPISLFGMSVAASELPELSRISKEKLDAFLGRVERSTRQVLYLVVPTVVGYLGFGILLVGVLVAGGAAGEADVWLVYLILVGYTLGLGATAVSRLLQNSFYALGDTKTPAKIAVARVSVSATLGAALMFWLDGFGVSAVLGLPVPDEPLTLAAVGLALGSSAGAWVELAVLQRALRRHTAAFRLPGARALQMLGLAGLAAVPAAAVFVLVPASWNVAVRALLVIGVYGPAYLALGHALGFEEGETWLGRFFRRLK
jgi:putative peptidoglycan lipid II flippase